MVPQMPAWHRKCCPKNEPWQSTHSQSSLFHSLSDFVTASPCWWKTFVFSLSLCACMPWVLHSLGGLSCVFRLCLKDNTRSSKRLKSNEHKTSQDITRHHKTSWSHEPSDPFVSGQETAREALETVHLRNQISIAIDEMRNREANSRPTINA